MQDTAEDDADNALEQACKNVCDWVEENEAAIKITVGTAVIAGTGAAAVVTGGAAAKNFLGAAIGGVAGGLLHMLFADDDEKTEGFADGYLLGAVAGATSPSIASLVSSLKNASPLLSNPAVLASIEGFLETAVEEFVLILEGENINLASVGVDFLINCFTSGHNPQMDKLGKEMEKVAKKLGKWFEDTVGKGKKLIDDLPENNGSKKKKTPEVKKETENQSSKLVLPYNLQFFANKGSKASELPTVVKGTKEWDEAVKSIENGGSTSYRTRTATEAKELLNEARGNMNRYKQYTSKKYKKGYEMHPNEINTRNAPHNDLPHVKWKDWLDELNSGKGHIFFDTPN